MRAEGTNSCMRLRQRMNVDFPQPDGPMIAVARCAAIDRLISFNTRLSPNHAETFCAISLNTSGAAASGGGTLFRSANMRKPRQRIGAPEPRGRKQCQHLHGPLLQAIAEDDRK